MEVLLQILAAFVAALLFYIFYNYSFFHPREYRLQTIAFLFGISAVGLVMLLQTLIFQFWPTSSAFVRAFFYAAFIEETAKFLFIYLLVKIHHHVGSIEINVAEGIFYGILVGISFGIIENLFYGMHTGIWTVILRSITSLPLHLLTSIIIAYYVTVFHFDNKNNLAWTGLLSGAILVIFFHGVYNYSVFSGSAFLIVAPLLLVVMFIVTEYIIAKSKTFLPDSVLSLIGIRLDDYECIRKHRHYLEWLDREQAIGTRKQIPLFRKPARTSLAAFIIFSLVGISMGGLYFLSPQSIGVFFPGIGYGEYINIFIFFPLFISFTYLTGGILNPNFISNRITGVPLISIAVISVGEYSEDSIIYSLDKKIFFATLQNPEKLKGNIYVRFWIAGREFKLIPAKVVWINQSEENITETGALIILDRLHPEVNLLWNWNIIKHIIKNAIYSLKKRRISVGMR